jgi:protocatechuate 3,4-dioxygenase beta subunit
MGRVRALFAPGFQPPFALAEAEELVQQSALRFPRHQPLAKLAQHQVVKAFIRQLYPQIGLTTSPRLPALVLTWLFCYIGFVCSVNKLEPTFSFLNRGTMFPTKTYIDPATSSRQRFLRVASTLFVAIVIPVWLVIGVFALSLASPAVAEEAGPAAPGTIAGMVKDTDGTPLATIEISLYRQSSYAADSWSVIRSMRTQADGKYRFTILPVGNYRIGATDLQQMRPPLFYPAAPTIHKATDINVIGNQFDGIDLNFYPGGQITGVVTATTGVSLTTGSVSLQHEVKRQGVTYWESVQSTYIPPGGGIYTFTNLSANSYRVCANGFGPVLAAYECYDNVNHIRQATPLTITSGATISNVNFVLGDFPDHSQISGRVTDLNNQPLADIGVYAFGNDLPPFVRSIQATTLAPDATPVPTQPFPPPDGPPASSYSYYTSTDSQGNYRFTNIAEGAYRLLFRDPTNAHAFEYYNDSGAPEEATIVALGSEQTITNVNVQLAPAGRIRGAVTIAGQAAPIRFLRAQLKTSLGWYYAMDSENVTSDGVYEISGLPVGVYRVWTYALIPDLYTNYFYQGYYFVPDAADLSEEFPFTKIPLGIGETKTANIALVGGPQFDGSLSGQVTAGGAPLAGAKVLLYANDAFCCLDQRPPLVSVLTNSDGRYTINGLTASSFYLGATDPTGLYATTYYTAHAAPTIANPIAVAEGQTINNINVDLPLAGAIGGRVTRPNGEPVPDLLVRISHLTKPFAAFIAVPLPIEETHTDAAGRYTVKGLHPGDYNLCVQNERGFTKCHGMRQGLFDPTIGRVTVGAGATTPNIDVRWGPDLKNYLPIIAR